MHAYAVDAQPLQEVDVRLEHFRRFRNQRLDALSTELARGKRERGERRGDGPSGGGRPPTKSEEDT
ncbi:hypothetical protein [Streptosporangium roseum]|uniref:hypothetical protein n=1 Tax=Streptosporangium roseum TaxID=2001 RepID=UPI0001A3DB46|nr:hypothetical protein [Streptosporangium roseum]